MYRDKLYTIYDNADGGYTIWYQYWDRYTNKCVKKYLTFDYKESMIKYRTSLEKNGYKFVGKL